MNVSVVVPVFNSEASLCQLVDELRAALPSISAEYEIILVNDGSLDPSWQIVQELANHDSRIRGINLERNFGQHNAILCGVRAAKHPFCVTLDDDLQHPPSEIPKLLFKLADGFDLVYGSSSQRTQTQWRKVCSVVVKSTLYRVFGIAVYQYQTPFRAFRTQLRDHFSEYRSSIVNIDGLLSRTTSCFTSVPVQARARLNGKSTYSFAGLVRHTNNTVIAATSMPLNVVTRCCMISAVFMAGVLICFCCGINAHPQMQQFLAITVSLTSIAALLSISITSGYLSKIYAGMINPQYLVRDDTHDESRAKKKFVEFSR